MPDINIPIFHCFNDNYVLPAAVSFDSMLRNASKKFNYKLFVAGDVSKNNQDRLVDIVRSYSNASLDFIDADYDFDEIFSRINNSHYSKDVFLKILVPNLLESYSKAIITDVDVVWLGDISLVWSQAGSLDSNYLAAVKPINAPHSNFYDGVRSWYLRDFSPEELDYLDTGGGLWVFNLDLMRRDKIPDKAIDFAINNAHRLIQAEQDVMNLVVAENKKLLSPRMMVCNYFYDIYPDVESAQTDLLNSKDEMIDAFLSPIQLHYPGSRKPWTHSNVTASQYWFLFLANTPFLSDWLVENQRRLDESLSVRRALKLIYEKLLTILIKPIKRLIPLSLKKQLQRLLS